MGNRVQISAVGMGGKGLCFIIKGSRARRICDDRKKLAGNRKKISKENFDEKIEKNYIGGATFLEIYDAFRLNKKIYLYNDIPKGMLYDEIQGFAPIIINGDISKIKEYL